LAWDRSSIDSFFRPSVLRRNLRRHLARSLVGRRRRRVRVDGRGLWRVGILDRAVEDPPGGHGRHNVPTDRAELRGIDGWDLGSWLAPRNRGRKRVRSLNLTGGRCERPSRLSPRSSSGREGPRRETEQNRSAGRRTRGRQGGPHGEPIGSGIVSASPSEKGCRYVGANDHNETEAWEGRRPAEGGGSVASS